MSARKQAKDAQAQEPEALEGKGKKGKKGKRTANKNAGTSVATHPRARAAVSRAKGWGGLVGFVLAAYAAYGAHLPLVQAGMHALVAGVAGYVLAWAAAVAICRQLVQTELKSIAQRLREAREAAGGSGENAGAKPAEAPAGG